MFPYRKNYPAEIQEALNLIETAKSKFSDIDVTIVATVFALARDSITGSKENADYFVRMIREQGERVDHWVYTFLINVSAK